MFAVLVLDTTTGEYRPALVGGKPFVATSRTQASNYADRVRNYLDTDALDGLGEPMVLVETLETV